MWSNKVGYGTTVCVYCTTNYVKVPFCIPEVSRSKVINPFFHVKNDKGESGIGYNMIIHGDLMVQIGLTAEFKRQSHQCDGATLHMIEPRGLLGLSDIHKHDMRKVVVQNADQFTQEKLLVEWLKSLTVP